MKLIDAIDIIIIISFVVIATLIISLIKWQKLFN